MSPIEAADRMRGCLVHVRAMLRTVRYEDYTGSDADVRARVLDRKIEQCRKAIDEYDAVRGDEPPLAMCRGNELACERRSVTT